ncbi:IS3 family transposase [Pectobacterium odoriferum]
MCGKAFVSREEALNAIFDYIEVFYHRRRNHSTRGYQTPVDYEMAAQLGGSNFRDRSVD